MRAFIDQYAVSVFCAVVVVLTFAVYLLPLPRTVLPFLIVFIPAAIGAGLTALEGKAVRAYFAQLAPARLSLKWVGVALLVGLALRIGVMLVGRLLGIPGSLKPGGFVPFLTIVYLVAAAAEEVGWRGYALPRLLRTQSPLAASLILGLPWAVLHLALYLPGMMSEGLPAVPTLIVLPALSVLLTWVWVGAERGGVLTATLLHTSQSAFTFLNGGIEPALMSWLMAVVWSVAAVIVFALVGPVLLIRRPSEEPTPTVPQPMVDG